MNNNQNSIISHVLLQLNCLDNVDENAILNLINIFKKLNPISDEEQKEVIKELHSKLAIKMDLGSYIKEKNYVPWYYNAKKDIDSRYWRRYEQYLNSKGFNKNIINSLDKTTDEILDLLGNPKQKENFFRKGLVIGDVQSGKTSTYTALINKAVDAGYRIIFLLTGTIEKLRQQTQGRIDEGFVGLDSTALVNMKSSIYVGVGNFDSSCNVWSITSTSNDFSASTSTQFVGRIADVNFPVIFVLKKNKSVLDSLESWIRTLNTKHGIIDAPMLMIDDEADNASVNTKNAESPSTINACIRKLIKLFSHANYVGFTATPYANIFINPDTDDEMLKQDLFPRDFIYVLEPPTNYIGASSVFMPNGLYNFMIENNDDCEYVLPEKHKKNSVINMLPFSLKKAIISFFITNVIRDLRHQYKTHRSMLINISRFINVQESIKEIVEDYVRDCQREYKMYCMSGERALNHENIKLTKDIYDYYYVNKDIPSSIKGEFFDWNTIQQNLYKSCSSIVVRTVNGGNAQKNLNYDSYKEDGLRIIAIGGFSLSRGLTLEGLSTSYFYRNSKMYDTLMQMGRWFGYRDNYVDLCKIWMSSTSCDWYQYITEAQDDLKTEVKKMMNLGKTPKEFGLGVRNDQSSLLVTAVNKMRNTKDINMYISLSGTLVETPYISIKNNNDNIMVIKNWINEILSLGYSFTNQKIYNDKLTKLEQIHKQILSIDKKYIIELLTLFKVSPYNYNFRTEDIIKMINNDSSNILSRWDLIIASNSRSDELVEIADGLCVAPVSRSFSVDMKKDFIQINSTKSRLGSISFAKGGLCKDEVRQIEEFADKYKSDAKKGHYGQNDYFNTGFKRNPLLIIYPVKLTENKNESINYEVNDIDFEKAKSLCYGLAVGIPDVEGKGKIYYSYKINLVKWKEIIGTDDDYMEETGDE